MGKARVWVEDEQGAGWRGGGAGWGGGRSGRGGEWRWGGGGVLGSVGSMAHTLTIEYGDEVLLGLGLSPAEFAGEARLVLAAKLYEMGRLTSGQAARLCGLSRVEFLVMLPRLGVPVSNLKDEDVEDDIAFAQRG